MFLWYPVLDLARAPRRTARKKGSGYENENEKSEAKMAELTSNINEGRKQFSYHFPHLIPFFFLTDRIANEVISS